MAKKQSKPKNTLKPTSYTVDGVTVKGGRVYIRILERCGTDSRSKTIIFSDAENKYEDVKYNL